MSPATYFLYLTAAYNQFTANVSRRRCLFALQLSACTQPLPYWPLHPSTACCLLLMQTALAEANIAAGTVDRDALLAALRAKWGANGWVSCDPITKRLVYVAVCLDPKDPSQLAPVNWCGGP